MALHQTKEPTSGLASPLPPVPTTDDMLILHCEELLSCDPQWYSSIMCYVGTTTCGLRVVLTFQQSTRDRPRRLKTRRHLHSQVSSVCTYLLT
jgi:hypothetical protein